MSTDKQHMMRSATFCAKQISGILKSASTIHPTNQTDILTPERQKQRMKACRIAMNRLREATLDAERLADILLGSSATKHKKKSVSKSNTAAQKMIIEYAKIAKETNWSAIGGGMMLLSLLQPDSEEASWSELLATICLALIKQSADLHLSDRQHNRTGLLLVCMSRCRSLQRPIPSYNVTKRLPEILIEYGAALTDSDNRGETALLALARHVLLDEQSLQRLGVQKHATSAAAKSIIGDEYDRCRILQIMLLNWISLAGDIFHVGLNRSTVFSLLARAFSIRNLPIISPIAVLLANETAVARGVRFRTTLTAYLLEGLSAIECLSGLAKPAGRLVCPCGCVGRICAIVADYMPFSVPLDAALTSFLSSSSLPSSSLKPNESSSSSASSLLLETGTDNVKPGLRSCVDQTVDRFRRLLSNNPSADDADKQAALFDLTTLSALDGGRSTSVGCGDSLFLDGPISEPPVISPDERLPLAVRFALIDAGAADLLLRYIRLQQYISNYNDRLISEWPALMALRNLAYGRSHARILVRSGVPECVLGLLSRFLDNNQTATKTVTASAIRWLIAAIGLLGNLAQDDESDDIRISMVSIISTVAAYVLPPPPVASTSASNLVGTGRQEPEFHLAQVCAITLNNFACRSIGPTTISTTICRPLPCYLVEERLLPALDRCLAWTGGTDAISAMHALAVGVRACNRSNREDELAHSATKRLIECLPNVLVAAFNAWFVVGISDGDNVGRSTTNVDRPESIERRIGRRTVWMAAAFVEKLSEWMAAAVVSVSAVMPFIRCLLPTTTTNHPFDADEFAAAAVLIACGHIFRSDAARSVFTAAYASDPKTDVLFGRILRCLSYGLAGQKTANDEKSVQVHAVRRRVSESAAFAVGCLLSYGSADDVGRLFDAGADAVIRTVIFDTKTDADDPVAETLLIGIACACSRAARNQTDFRSTLPVLLALTNAASGLIK